MNRDIDAARTVLLVEDDRDDVALIARAMELVAPESDLRVVGTVADALGYLHGVGAFADRDLHPEPRLLIVDLHLPDGDGLSVVEAARARPELAVAPVVVLTGRDGDDERVKRALDAGANSFVRKGPALEAVAERVAAYWLRIDQNPGQL